MSRLRDDEREIKPAAEKTEEVVASPSMQEYLEALHHLERKTRPVRPASVASHVGVSSSAAGEMLKRLAMHGLVERTPDHGVLLTEKGRLEASRVVRRHRLSERFLVDILGLPWYGAHEEACKLEHALSAESEEGLARLLGDVSTCPHGNPIPDADGNEPELQAEVLTDLQPSESGCIVRITDENRDELQYLATLGLLPGVEVTVEERAPFNGPVMISVGRTKYALGREIAGKIWVSLERSHDLYGHHHRHGHNAHHRQEHRHRHFEHNDRDE